MTVPGGNDQDIKYYFIRRPVLAGVISLIVTLMGVLAIRLLPVSRYPQISPPAIQVVAVYPGATAQDVAEAVAAPIEQQLSGLQGMLYYTSANAGDGTMSLTIYFDVNRNQDLAAVDVQNAVQLASPQLPAAVRQLGISIIKANSDILGVVGLSSSDPRYDAAYLTNYMHLYVEDELKSVQGVGNATTFGGLQFSMLMGPAKVNWPSLFPNSSSQSIRFHPRRARNGRITAFTLNARSLIWFSSSLVASFRAYMW